jgi:lyso-ornithine lipid O-acyltransferase
MTALAAPARLAPSPAQRIAGAARLAGSAALLLLVAVPLVPVQWLILARAPHRSMLLPVLVYRLLVRLIGIEVVIHGTPRREPGALHVANHLSWTDIPLLGARLGTAFVAKSEVRAYPLIGWLAGLAGTLFIERDRTGRAPAQAAELQRALLAGERLMLFPEGTSTDGRSVLPFKSALFAAVDGLPPDAPIQPVTIAYTRLGGRPLADADRERIAWIGDAALLPHAIQLLALAPVRAELVFHPATCRADHADRKALAAACRAAVDEGRRWLAAGVDRTAAQARTP